MAEQFEVTEEPNQNGLYDPRYPAMERRIEHLDREVNDVKSDVNDVKTRLAGMESRQLADSHVLQQIAERVNAPRTMNVWTIIAGVGVLTGMLAYYVELNQTPVKNDLIEMREKDKAIQGSASAAGRIADEALARTKNNAELIIRSEGDLTDIWRRVHVMEQQLAKLEERGRNDDRHDGRIDLEIKELRRDIAKLRGKMGQ